MPSGRAPDLVWLLKKVETLSWTVGGKSSGTWVTSRNLTYVKVLSLLSYSVLMAANSIA